MRFNILFRPDMEKATKHDLHLHPLEIELTPKNLNGRLIHAQYKYIEKEST